MMIQDKSTVPPGGWCYDQPETGAHFKAMSWSRLCRLVRQHRQGNGLDIEDGWELRLEEQWCLANPDLCGVGTPRTQKKNAPGWGAVVQFARTMWEWAKSGQLATQEEAERRAAICAMCPMNVKMSGCLGCTGVAKYAEETLMGRTTLHDATLQVCMACGCYLKVKVHVPGEVLDKAEKGIEYPENCWRFRS
jgi:hypothetical protein